MRGSRKLVGFSFVTAAAVALAASAAFACTSWVGKFTITSTATGGSGNKTATAIGQNRGTMNYCNGGTPVTVTVSSTGTFTASVAPATTCLFQNKNQMPDGTANVNYISGTVAADCMDSQTGKQTLGTMSVTSGSGSGTYPQTGYVWTPTLGNGSYLCVANGGWANQIPAWVV